MVLEFLFAGTLATGITFKEEISRASVNNLPASKSTARTGIQKELYERAYEARQGREYEKAIPLLIRAIKLDPYYPFYYSDLGICHHYLGKFDIALECYDKALDLEGKVYNTDDDYLKEVRKLSKMCEKEINKDSKKVQVPIKKGRTNVNMVSANKGVRTRTKGDAKKSKE